MLTNYLFKHFLTVRQLLKHGVHLGLQSTLLHSTMLQYLLPSLSYSFSIFNLRYTLSNLRLFINLVIELITKRRLILLINSNPSLATFLSFYFLHVNQAVSKEM